MKKALVVLMLATSLGFVSPALAQKLPSRKLTLAERTAVQESKEDFRETLSRATLAVYVGKQTCGYKSTHTIFGDIPEWTCGFESHFVCTATVIAASGTGEYVGLTAGHCFDYVLMDKGYRYFVSDGVNAHPVLRSIDLIKFEYNDQYDYGLFHFSSTHEYPAISVAGAPQSGVIKNEVPPLGTRVLNVNFSLGIVKETTEGIVVSKQISETEASDEPSLRRRYMIQLPFGPGASGSPIVDESTHRVIGLVEAYFPGTQMASVVIPTGDNFAAFVEDQSVGIRPQPEPAPKAQPRQEEEEDDSVMGRIRALIRYFKKH